MKMVKAIYCGIAVLGFASASAFADVSWYDTSNMSDSSMNSASISSSSPDVTYQVYDVSPVYYLYPVDIVLIPIDNGSQSQNAMGQ